MLVETHMESTEDVLDFVAQRIASLPGVLATELTLVVRQTGWRPAEWRPHKTPQSDWLAEVKTNSAEFGKERWWTDERAI